MAEDNVEDNISERSKNVVKRTSDFPADDGLIRPGGFSVRHSAAGTGRPERSPSMIEPLQVVRQNLAFLPI